MNSPRLSYRPNHPPGCECVVCLTADFCDHMHARNDARQARCREIFSLDQTRKRSYWHLEKHVKGTPFVGDIFTTTRLVEVTR